MKYQRLFLLIIISAFAIGACKKDESSEKPKNPDNKVTISLSTIDINNISKNSAESGVSIRVIGSASIDEVGICWSKNSSPTLRDNSISGALNEDFNNSSKSFDLNIQDLDSNTNYYVRAYAVYKDSIYYGNELTFQTNKGLESENIYWILGDIINLTTFNADYGEDNSKLVLVEYGEKLSVCEIQFNNSIQAPKEYSVMNQGDTLLSSQASIKIITDWIVWESIQGDSKIKTSIENGKYKIEFQDVEMMNITDSTKAKSSASFYVVP